MLHINTDILCSCPSDTSSLGGATWTGSATVIPASAYPNPTIHSPANLPASDIPDRSRGFSGPQPRVPQDSTIRSYVAFLSTPIVNTDSARPPRRTIPHHATAPSKSPGFATPVARADGVLATRAGMTSARTSP
ncbi:hypothetical protein K438DRAFT_325900 [Mycena galopus ATCC 62051]|nr:hypothetical protein K438DRAFT_325900 [Mycena galopus ATCC 62051]